MRMRVALTGRRLAVALTSMTVAAAFCPPASAAWEPGPARYGVAMDGDVSVRMSDGTGLRVDVYRPTDKATGRPAAGPFPVLLVQTPYGKRSTNALEPIVPEVSAGILQTSGVNRYLVERGYIQVVADVRGTGASQGTWGLFDPIQAQDGAELVRWSAKLPGSTGRVGLFGASYLGIIQFLTAARLERGSPLKAIFPVVAANEPYRDTAFPGGLPGAEFALVYLGLTGSLNLANPIFTNPDPSDLALAELQHIAGFLNYHVPTLATAAVGGDQAFDEEYWRARSPVYRALAHIARNRVPAMLLGGWYDLFGRGTPLNYSGLQNAAAGRSVHAPMRVGQPVDPRYQLIMGPWYHVTAGKGLDVQALMLRWFDRWLKGERTGIDETRSPMRMYVLGADRYVDAAHWPFAKATARTWYFASGPSGSAAPSPNDGRLTTDPPSASSGADPLVWTLATSPCNGSTETWSAGFTTAILTATASHPDPAANPCARDDRQRQIGPGALTYTSPPFDAPTLIAGPIGATIYAIANTPDVELVVTIEDVAPGGVSTPLTQGVLLGSHRALDRERSWLAPDGRPLLPHHPFTRAAQAPVPTGRVTRFDIEVFPTLAQLAAGHRLRLTVNSADTPRILPTVEQGSRLVGGIYQLQRTKLAPSSLTVPVATPDALDVPGAVARCQSRRRFTINIRVPRRAGRITRTTVTYAGRRAHVTGSGRLSRRALIDLRKVSRQAVRVRIVVRTSSGRTYRFTRTYRPCRPR